MTAASRVDQQQANRNALLGCALLLLVALVLGGGSLALFIQHQLDAVRYPGSTELRGQSYLTLRPDYLRLENAYRARDDFVPVRNWYIVQHGLRVVEEGEDCVGLSDSNKTLFARHLTSVLICDTPRGQFILVTRLISRQ